MLVGAFFLDGLATAAEQLCGQAVGARDRRNFRRAVRLDDRLGFGLASPSRSPSRWRPMAGRPDDREPGRAARRARLSDLRGARFRVGVFAFAYDGIYVGATWTRDMRNLMLVSLASISPRGGCSGRSATPGSGSRS